MHLLVREQHIYSHLLKYKEENTNHGHCFRRILLVDLGTVIRIRSEEVKIFRRETRQKTKIYVFIWHHWQSQLPDPALI